MDAPRADIATLHDASRKGEKKSLATRGRRGFRGQRDTPVSGTRFDHCATEYLACNGRDPPPLYTVALTLLTAQTSPSGPAIFSRTNWGYGRSFSAQDLAQISLRFRAAVFGPSRCRILSMAVSPYLPAIARSCVWDDVYVLMPIRHALNTKQLFICKCRQCRGGVTGFSSAHPLSCKVAEVSRKHVSSMNSNVQHDRPVRTRVKRKTGDAL